MDKPTIVVIGSINNDLIISVEKLPRIGETVAGYGFMMVAGGKGANQAVAVARLGGDVHMIGAVGDDSFGRELKQNLVRNSVSDSYVSVKQDCPTGTALIVLHKGDNAIIIDAGANGRVDINAVAVAEDLIKKANMLILQLEIPIETAEFAMEIARRHNVPILLNPAPACRLPDRILQMVDIITPNETECEIITGIKTDNMQGAKKAVAYLCGKGVKQVVITMGSEGAAFNDGNEVKHIPARRVKEVLDTTAAGDSFTAGLAVALTEGKNISEAVLFATVAGSIAVTKKGAQPSLPYREEVEKLANGQVID